MPKPSVLENDEPIHEYFGLTYAQFLVVSRTALQSMPVSWQHRLVQCLRELEDSIDNLEPEWPWAYHVTVRHHGTGKFGSLAKADRLGAYARGRARVPLKKLPETITVKGCNCILCRLGSAELAAMARAGAEAMDKEILRDLGENIATTNGDHRNG